jgi:predicted amidophosphoribosyltransferase
MAVCWRCPECSEVSCEEDVNLIGPVSCDHCDRPFPQNETLCTVCDSPNPWARRDSIHFLCRECGTTQMFLSHRVSAIDSRA